MHIDLDDVEFVTETSVTIRQSRRRTTVPKEIVDRLDLSNTDRLRWVLLRDGTVVITKARTSQASPSPARGGSRA